MASQSSRPADELGAVPGERLAKGFSLTRRAVVLMVIVAALALMYATSLRVYFDQQIQISKVKAEIAAKQASIDKLTDEIKRWNDGEYVKAQARSRLGWVVPGEVGYRVIGPDGKLIGGGVELAKTVDTPESAGTWWQKMWGSVRVADAPQGKADKPAPKPSASSTP